MSVSASLAARSTIWGEKVIYISVIRSERWRHCIVRRRGGDDVSVPETYADGW